MSYRPDENILISWLYGELDEAERAKVEKYLQENPEELKKIQQLRDVSDIMNNVQDKEVIAPPLFMDDVKTVSFWRSNSFKTIMSIAASFLVLIVAAKILNLNISYSDNALTIAFGEIKTKEVHATPSLDANDVQKMIDSSLQQNNTDQINEMVRKASAASQADIRNFVATLQRDNLSQLRDYLQLSASDQRKYTDNLIVEFSKYLQEQRGQDLNMYQTRFNQLEHSTDQLKSETEQILASIISSSPQIQQSSY